MESPKSYKHMIIVCGHATYLGDGCDISEPEWSLQTFQKSSVKTGKRSEHETFIEHIHAGKQALRNDPDSILIFSGGRTASSSRSEAASYMLVLAKLGGTSADDDERILLEENATDSYQNLLFSIMRYREHIGAYPQHITVITHAFKERRFLDLHGPSIQWPFHGLRVQGINPPFSREELISTEQAEKRNAYNLFKSDPFGLQEPLNSKRRSRGWRPENTDKVIFAGIEPVVERLLRWDGGHDGSRRFLESCSWEEL